MFFQDSVGRAQKYVQSELERFQETLHRCVLSCQVYLLTISKPQFKVQSNSIIVEKMVAPKNSTILEFSTIMDFCVVQGNS